MGSAVKVVYERHLGSSTDRPSDGPRTSGRSAEITAGAPNDLPRPARGLGAADHLLRRARLHLPLALAALMIITLLGVAPARAARVLVTSEPRTDLRIGPTREHQRVTVLPPGIRLWAEDFSRGFYQVRLASALTAWVEQGHVQPLDPSVSRPPVQSVGEVELRAEETGTILSVPIEEPVAWRIRQQIDPPALVLDLFRVRLAHYGTRQFPTDRTMWASTSRRMSDDWSQLVFYLNGGQQRGCRVGQTDGRFRLLVRAPYADPEIAGKVVVIDPGHGGSDRGAVGPTGLREKDVNLRIALQLAVILCRRGATPRLLRESDRSVGPPGSPQRVELEARLAASELQADADFFLSIHNNAVGRGSRHSAYGTESYYWTPMSAVPAAIMQKHLCARLGTKNRLVGWAPFYVLRNYDVPRVLVECAYISNPTEEQRLRRPDFQAEAALALADALEEFFARAVVAPPMIPAPALPAIATPEPIIGPTLDPSPMPGANPIPELPAAE